MKKVIVVGSGIGGLTAGALLAKDGAQVTVLEAMTELSGCAGKYRRHPYTFATGATLGMALEPGGIHERIFRYLNVEVEAQQLDHVMDLHHPHRTISFSKDRQKHVKEMQRAFPGNEEKIEGFYQEVFDLANRIRTLMKPLPVMPPDQLQDVTAVAKVLRPTHLKLVPILLQPLESILRKHGLHDLEEFRHILDGILIDSMQTTSRHASALFSCIALDIYHEGAYYVNGGLYRFGEVLAEVIMSHGGRVKKPRTVTKLTRDGSGWTVEDHRGTIYEADAVVFNGDPRSLEGLLEPHQWEQLPKKIKLMPQKSTWGTYSLYIAIDSSKLEKSFAPFQQISHGPNGEMDEGWHFFVSVSKPEDRLRAPEGYQTVTISTHTNLEYWKTKESYDAYREMIKKRILDAVEQYYPGFQLAIDFIEDGAPRGWENYTLRTNGYVGGFAQTPWHALFGAASHRSGLPGLYLCGDHIFPGGGTIGVTTSGLHAARSIAKKPFI
ncbi:phytoene desaturase family protein [Chryseomicrobium imtechense]